MADPVPAATTVMDECASALRQRGLPHQVRKQSGDFEPPADSIKVMTMHASKGLEFPVVALPGVGHMPAEGEERGGGGAAVLCGGHPGDAEAGGDGEWQRGIRAGAGPMR